MRLGIKWPKVAPFSTARLLLKQTGQALLSA
jgi:hypothetical protein